MASPEILKKIEEIQKKKIKKQENDIKTEFYHPLYKYYGLNRNVRNPVRSLDYRVLRRVAEKAWLINTIIGHIIDKVVPYLQPKTDKSRRGFSIEMKNKEGAPNAEDKKKIKAYTDFYLNTGFVIDPEREDDLISYVKKILRDELTLDQVATELQRNRKNDIIAFWAVDSGTIVRCDELGYEGDDKIRFVQMIDERVVAKYGMKDMIFQYSNPRTDIYNYGYGYSKVEQAISLIVTLINSFAYNAGAFTEDKLPRGMLLLSGDASVEVVEQIEDYIIDVMSSPSSPLGKWSIPIIPAGMGGKEGSKNIEWVPLNHTNQDMQFSRWQDTLYMSVGALYGVDLESMGIKSEKGAKIIESGSKSAREYSDDKGIGSALMFLKQHFQRIQNQIDPEFSFVFHGFEREDTESAMKSEESALKTKKSVNEIRVENDLPKIKEDWADVPAIGHPSIIQAFMASKNQQPEEDQGFDYGEEENKELTEEDFTKSLVNDIIIRI
jgi:hypothetical protein